MLIEDVVSLMEPQHIANLKKAFPKDVCAEKNCSEALAELEKQLDNKNEQLKNSNRTASLAMDSIP